MKKIFIALCFLLIGNLAHALPISKTVDFKFQDINGKSVQLSKFKGKWVLVNFWAPWCPRCKMEFSSLNDLDALPNFAVVGVAMDYGIDQSQVFSTVSRYNLRFPTIMGTGRRDPLSPALQVGPVDFYPTSYLYNPKGEIVMFIPGIISKQKILSFIDQK